MKNKNLIMGIIITLIVIVGIIIVVKKPIETKVANEIITFWQENKVANLIEEETGMKIDFSDIEVSATRGELIAHNLKVDMPVYFNLPGRMSVENAVIYFKEMKIGTSYKDLLNMVKTEEFTEIKSFNLNFQNPYCELKTFRYNDAKWEWEEQLVNIDIADNIIISYNGTLRKSDIEKIANEIAGSPVIEIPKINHTLSIDLIGFNAKAFQEAYPDNDPIMEEIMSNLDLTKSDFGVELAYLGKNQRIEIKTYQKNKYGRADVSLMADYTGETTNDVNLTQIMLDMRGAMDNLKATIPFSVNENFAIDFGTWKYGLDYSSKGNLNNLFMPVNDPSPLISIFNNTGLDFEFDIQDLTVNVPIDVMAEMKRDFPFEFPDVKNNQFDLKKFRTNIEYNNSSLKADLNFIESSFISMSADLDLSILIEQEDVKINKLSVEIEEIWSEEVLTMLVDGSLGQGTYSMLPKNGKNVKIDISGSFDNPKLKLNDGSEISLY